MVDSSSRSRWPVMIVAIGFVIAAVLSVGGCTGGSRPGGGESNSTAAPETGASGIGERSTSEIPSGDRPSDPVTAGLAVLRAANAAFELDDHQQVCSLSLSGRHVDDAMLEHVAAFQGLRSLRLESVAATDHGLRHLAGLKQMDQLFLIHTDFTDAGLEHLQGLSSLRTLHLAYCMWIRGTGLEFLTGLKSLETLSFLPPKEEDSIQRRSSQHTQIGDEGFVYLAEMKQLQRLELPPVQWITESGLQRLKALTGLRELNLDGVQLTDVGLVHLAGLTDLETLRISHAKITDAGLAHLGGLTKLKRLSLQSTGITATGLGHLKNLKRLEALELSRCKEIDDNALVQVQLFPNLQELDLTGLPISDAGAKHLGKSKHLQSLKLLKNAVSTGFTNTGLSHLTGLAQLRRLELNGVNINDEGIQHLRHFTQLKELELENVQATDEGIGVLGSLTNLTSLRLRDHQISDAGLEFLAKLDSLQELELTLTSFTGTCLANLSDARQLRKLSINARVNDDALLHIGRLNGLESLHFDQKWGFGNYVSAITRAGIVHLGELQNLRVLDFGYQITMADADMADVARLKALRVLELLKYPMTDAGLEHLAKLTQLRELSFKGDKISDDGLAHLYRLNRLELVSITGGRFSQSALQELERSLPHCHIVRQ